MCTENQVREVISRELSHRDKRIDAIDAIVRLLPAQLTHLDDILAEHTKANIRIENSVSEVDQKVTFTNGKVAELIRWREQVKGASTALKGIWGVLAIFVITAIFGVFWMWVEFQSLDDKIRNTLASELENYEFNITE